MGESISKSKRGIFEALSLIYAMHILVITDSYPPEIRSAAQLMKDLADGLKERGHRITVATSYPKYNLHGEQKYFVPIILEGGISVLRIKTLPHHKVNFVVRGIAQLLLPFIFFSHIKKHIKEKIDVVIIHSPPLPLSIAAYKVKQYYGAKFILNLHDIFPQNAVDLNILHNKLLIHFFEYIEQTIYRKTDFFVVPSEEHKTFLVNNRALASEKIRVIPHWIHINSFGERKASHVFRKKYNLENKCIFLFAGVLGPSQGLEFVLRVAERLKTISDIHFLFVGDGTALPSLLAIKERRNLSNVSFYPFVDPEKEYPLLLNDVDVGVLCLTAKNTTPAVPAKLMGYLAAGLPVVAFLHKESGAHSIIKEAECGLSCLSGDEEGAVQMVKQLYSERALLSAYGARGCAYAKNHFDVSVCIDAWDRHIRDLV